MRRLSLLFVILAALMLLPAAGQARSSRKLDIKVMSVLSGVSQPTKTSLRMTDRLYNLVPQFGKPKGALVGTDSGTLKKTGTISFSFSGIARLPGGTLNVRGQVIGGESISNLNIAGGTGQFKGARGIVVIREMSGKGRAANIFHLTLG